MTRAEQIEDILTRGVAEVIDRGDLERQLKGKKKLRVKLGIDPTSPNIHIGRAVVLWKLRAFQELGHQVVFIVGDFTGLIGDTSDKDSERPMLAEAQVKKNLKTYFSQAFKILDRSKTETHYNSKWLKKLGFTDVGRLADLFGLHEFEARENIAKRLRAGKRVSLRELLYPLMQGYDSVAVKADVELGGTDQKFNLLAGRVIQKAYGQRPQNILTTELLEGTDGRKMSSSWGNVVNLTDEPNDMFGKIMSIPDSLIGRYFLLATRLPHSMIKELVESKGPRDQKEALALAVTELYHGPEAARRARGYFTKVFSERTAPEDVEERRLPPGVLKLSDVLVETGLALSKSEARRLIAQRGVKVDGRAAETDGELTFDGTATHLLQVGKRRFLRLR